MSKSRLWNSISIFESTLSAAEWAWRIVALLIIGGSGTLGGVIASTDPFFKKLGVIYWFIVFIFTAFATALIIFLVKAANLKQSQVELNQILANPRTSINPLATSFQDIIVPVEDLRLPTIQLHENKHFKRCKIVGPASIAILGGTYVNNHFTECGDIISLPDNVYLTGIIALKNCTVEECQFIRVSIFTDQGTAKAFAKIPGAIVKGLL